MSEDLINLAQMPAFYLQERGERLSYTSLWKLAVEGAIPSVRHANRIYVPRHCVPQTEQAMRGRRRCPAPAA